MKWFEDLKYTGKDNLGWYRFDARHKGRTAIYRRNQGEAVPGFIPLSVSNAAGPISRSDRVRGSVPSGAASVPTVIGLA